MTLKHLIILALLLAGCASSAPRDQDIRSNTRAASLEDLLDDEILRRFPGVRMYRDGEGIHIRIRGSLKAPLYIVDGMPLAPTPSGALWGISPHDIESIEVVRDLARLSYYGMRGANGVVLITTKRR